MPSSEDLDQYFTKRILAEKLYKLTTETLDKENVQYKRWLEPAAGDGAFYHLLPSRLRLGIDIHKQAHPDVADVIECDFMDLENKIYDGMYFVSIGNPPFGKNAALAVQFFNKCAQFCSAIAFIVPKTFMKYSVQNRLDPFFSIAKEVPLQDNSFEIDGHDKSVPCVFQIWIKKDEKREKIATYRDHPDLTFLPTDRLGEATILFQRVGGGAGAWKNPSTGPEEPGTGPGRSWKSNYHILCSEETAEILRTLNDWPTKHHTAGNPSISKSDLIKAYIKATEKS